MTAGLPGWQTHVPAPAALVGAEVAAHLCVPADGRGGQVADWRAHRAAGRVNRVERLIGLHTLQPYTCRRSNSLKTRVVLFFHIKAL